MSELEEEYPKFSPMRRALFCLMIGSFAFSMQGQSKFSKNFQELMAGELDSLTLTEDLPFQQFSGEGWTYFNEHENKANPSGKVAVDRFYPITKKDVIEIRDELIVVLLQEKDSRKIRVASLQADGTPIQSFLLYDHYGYLYEKNFRSYSFDEPYRYDPEQKRFSFYQLIYGYEPLPSLESPTLDPIYYQSFNHLHVDAAGQFVRSEFEASDTYMFSQDVSDLQVHEVAFHELSIQYVSDKNRPESALWPEVFITHGDMESHDSIRIEFALGTEWVDRFFFFQLRHGNQITEVVQRHENILFFPGDGDNCSLDDWKRYRSDWNEVYLEEGIFSLRELSQEERKRFVPYERAELLEAFEKECGPLPESPTFNGVGIPHPDEGIVVTDRIILRIRFEGPAGKGTKYLIFGLPNGC